MWIYLSYFVYSFNGEMQPFCSRKKEQKQHYQEVEKYQKEQKKVINMKVLNSSYDMKEKGMR